MSTPSSSVRSCSLVASLLALALSGCAGSEEGVARPLTPIAEATAGDLAVRVLGERPLAAGQNRLFYQVTRAGQPLTEAVLVQRPESQRNGATRTCPTIDPAPVADADGLFAGMVIFDHGSTGTEDWALGLEVTEPGAAAPTALSTSPVPVAPEASVTLLTIGPTTFLVSLGFAREPSLGANPYTVSIHEPDASGKGWVGMTELSMDAAVLRPSSGALSADSIAPVHVGQGLYRGSTVFNRTGDWKLTITVRDAYGGPVGQVVFRTHVEE